MLFIFLVRTQKQNILKQSTQGSKKTRLSCLHCQQCPEYPAKRCCLQWARLFHTPSLKKGKIWVIYNWKKLSHPCIECYARGKVGGGGGTLPHIGYVGMCRGIRYVFWGSRSLYRVSFLPLLPAMCSPCDPLIDRGPKLYKLEVPVRKFPAKRKKKPSLFDA